MNYTENHILTMAALREQLEEVERSPQAARELVERYRLWEVFPAEKVLKRKKLLYRLHGKVL